jgi:hypothetical protein
MGKDLEGSGELRHCLGVCIERMKTQSGQKLCSGQDSKQDLPQGMIIDSYRYANVLSRSSGEMMMISKGKPRSSRENAVSISF